MNSNALVVSSLRDKLMNCANICKANLVDYMELSKKRRRISHKQSAIHTKAHTQKLEKHAMEAIQTKHA